jgi:hypothetical protein
MTEKTIALKYDELKSISAAEVKIYAKTGMSKM